MAKKVLVVDDEADILKLAVIRLEAAGYEVLKVASSEEALKMLEQNRPDLILLDMILPDMQGDEFCKKVKEDPALKKIPVILFTATIIGVPEKAREIGADDYIFKPFEPEELLFKIKKFIG